MWGLRCGSEAFEGVFAKGKISKHRRLVKVIEGSVNFFGALIFHEMFIIVAGHSIGIEVGVMTGIVIFDKKSVAIDDNFVEIDGNM